VDDEAAIQADAQQSQQRLLSAVRDLVLALVSTQQGLACLRAWPEAAAMLAEAIWPAAAPVGPSPPPASAPISRGTSGSSGGVGGGAAQAEEAAPKQLQPHLAAQLAAVLRSAATVARAAGVIERAPRHGQLLPAALALLGSLESPAGRRMAVFALGSSPTALHGLAKLVRLRVKLVSTRRGLVSGGCPHPSSALAGSQPAL
jgi:hypothetical protein